MKTNLIHFSFVFLFFLFFATISEAQKTEPGYLDFAEVMPEPIGGLQEIHKNAVPTSDPKTCKLL